MIKVIQENLNHGSIAQDLLEQTTRAESIDVCLISDPYKKVRNVTYILDKKKSASIWVSGKYPFQATNENEDGFVTANINGIEFYSCYAPPSMTLPEFQLLLDKIVQDARNKNPVVIAGDFNAWSTDWGSRLTTPRGEMLMETFAELQLVLANRGNTPTFRRVGGSSIVDLTFMSSAISRNVNWRVSEEYTHSDHQAIHYEIGDRNSTRGPVLANGPKWQDSKLDEETFTLTLEEKALTNDTAESLAEQLTAAISEACDVSMPRRIENDRKPPLYWWTDIIKDLRKQCLKARRVAQRSRRRENHEQMVLAFQNAKRTLKKAIKDSKRLCFKELIDSAEYDPWGKAYKTVMTKLKGGDKSPQLLCEEMLGKIVSTLFPSRDNELTHAPPLNEVSDIPQLTNKEVIDACMKFGDKKTPGPDGIPNKVFKLAVKTRTDMFIQVFEKCLQEGIFPDSWKVQHLVLLPKGKGLVGEPSSYRPICLCDTKGKALERIIYNRLLEHVDRVGGLSDYQFGFRKNRSTIDAIKVVVDIAARAIVGTGGIHGNKKYCAIITLDVKNAFNTADWRCIWAALERINTPLYLRKIIENYFLNRKLRYNTNKGYKFYNVSAGVPQGSVLGPLLWNIMYDGVLRIPLPVETTIIGFADDIVVETTAASITEVEEKANEAIKRIRRWLKESGLQLADHKTEAVLVTGWKKPEYMTIKVGEDYIKSKDALKYLGVMLDNRLNFKSHIKYASNKGASVQMALARMLPNIGGPKHNKRLLLTKVVSSSMLYAAPIFAHVLRIQDERIKMGSAYRLMALRTISGYRTISENAACVIAGLIPIDILAMEGARIYERKIQGNDQAIGIIRQEERDRSLQEWQDRWNAATNAEWTRQLIPQVKDWLEREHGETNYWLTQFLSGHGGYMEYLFRFNRVTTKFCPQCPTIEENARHVVFECPRFDLLRMPEIRPDNIIPTMISTDENWYAIEGWIASVQKELQRLENIRQNLQQ